MSSNQPQSAPSRSQKIVRWSLQILLAVVFLAAAGAKLAGVPMMVETFSQIGLGQWFRYLTAAVEIVGTLALLIPRFAAWGAVLLGATMTFAVLAHLTVLGTSPVPAAVLLTLCGFLVWLRRREVLSPWTAPTAGPA